MRFAAPILYGLVVSGVIVFSNPAYGAFDRQGNYYCNPTNIGLEKIIYSAAANKLNYEIDSYLSLNPDPVYQQFRDYILHSSSGTTQPTYDIMNKAQSCLSSNGINPLSIVTPVNLVAQIGYAPEFNLTAVVMIISIVGIVLISKFKLSNNGISK